MMAQTTIPLEAAVRNRLKTFGTAGMTYSEILTNMMDDIERERFVGWVRQRVDEVTDWVDLDDIK